MRPPKPATFSTSVSSVRRRQHLVALADELDAGAQERHTAALPAQRRGAAARGAGTAWGPEVSASGAARAPPPAVPTQPYFSMRARSVLREIRAAPPSARCSRSSAAAPR